MDSTVTLYNIKNSYKLLSTPIYVLHIVVQRFGDREKSSTQKYGSNQSLISLSQCFSIIIYLPLNLTAILCSHPGSGRRYQANAMHTSKACNVISKYTAFLPVDLSSNSYLPTVVEYPNTGREELGLHSVKVDDDTQYRVTI